MTTTSLILLLAGAGLLVVTALLMLFFDREQVSVDATADLNVTSHYVRTAFASRGWVEIPTAVGLAFAPEKRPNAAVGAELIPTGPVSTRVSLRTLACPTSPGAVREVWSTKRAVAKELPIMAAAGAPGAPVARSAVSGSQLPIVILSGACALLCLAGAVVAATLTGKPSAPTAQSEAPTGTDHDVDTATASPSTTAPTTSSVPASPTPTTADAAPGTLVAFITPSGNIACIISSTRNLAACELLEYTYTAPPKPSDCQGSYGDRVELLATGAQFVCHSDTIRNAPGSTTLAYGESVTLGGITCYSEETGVSCVHTTGVLFNVRRAEYVFGYANE